MAATALIFGCGHVSERGAAERGSIAGFVAAPLATDFAADANAADGSDARDAAAGNDRDSSDVRAALEPMPPPGKACETVVSCRAEPDAVDPRATSKELSHCAPTDKTRGAFSVRETREGRSRGVAVCCYVRFESCL